MGTELYPNRVSLPSTYAGGSKDIWPVTRTGNEIDLRVEFYRFLYGFGNEIPKGQVGILRRMRTDDSGDLIPCACVDSLTNEPDRDTLCPYCLGEGLLWDEEWIVYYKMMVASHEGMVRKDKTEKPGISNIPYAFFYVEHDVNPTRKDKIVEVVRDTNGNVIRPYQREAINTIATAEPFKSDLGRIEYWRLACSKDSLLSTWQTGA